MGAVMADFLVYPSQPWDAARPSGRLVALMQLPRFWIARARWRRELMELDARQMRDCGLDPLMVRQEALKPFWRD
jgi:uncharacterized protein YjiS (DUF1127 family)